MVTGILESPITCPACRHQKTGVMPSNACQWFYECEDCCQVLSSLLGDCCVFYLRQRKYSTIQED